MWNKYQWTIIIMLAAGAWAAVGAIAAPHRRERTKKEAALEVQEWENEGGAAAAKTPVSS